MILIGPPGSGQESLAQALAQKLGLPLRHGLGEGAGVFYLSEPFPPKEVGLALKPLPGRVLVVARSSFGEDPSFLLALRTRFPAEVTVVEQVPCLSWREAVGGPLRHLPFAEAARFYLRSGGRVEVLRELLAMGNPEALPQRVRAMVAPEARHLPWEARKALEVLALHPGPFPEKLAWILGYGEALDELEHRGWLLYCEGRYRFSEPQFRPYLTAGFGEGSAAACTPAWPKPGKPWEIRWPLPTTAFMEKKEKPSRPRSLEAGAKPWPPTQALTSLCPGPGCARGRSGHWKQRKYTSSPSRAKWRKLYWSWKSPSSSIYRGRCTKNFLWGLGPTLGLFPSGLEA